MFRKLITIAATLIAATGLAVAGAGIASADTGNTSFTATYPEGTASGGTVTWTCSRTWRSRLSTRRTLRHQISDPQR